MGGKRQSVSNEDFVKAWIRAVSVKDVAAATGLSPQSCSVKAGSLRKAGVKLPKLQRQKLVIDVAKLNEIIKEAVKKQK